MKIQRDKSENHPLLLRWGLLHISVCQRFWWHSPFSTKYPVHSIYITILQWVLTWLGFYEFKWKENPYLILNLTRLVQSQMWHFWLSFSRRDCEARQLLSKVFLYNSACAFPFILLHFFASYRLSAQSRSNSGTLFFENATSSDDLAKAGGLPLSHRTGDEKCSMNAILKGNEMSKTTTNRRPLNICRRCRRKYSSSLQLLSQFNRNNITTADENWFWFRTRPQSKNLPLYGPKAGKVQRTGNVQTLRRRQFCHIHTGKLLARQTRRRSWLDTAWPPGLSKPPGNDPSAIHRH